MIPQVGRWAYALSHTTATVFMLRDWLKSTEAWNDEINIHSSINRLVNFKVYSIGLLAKAIKFISRHKTSLCKPTSTTVRRIYLSFILRNHVTLFSLCRRKSFRIQHFFMNFINNIHFCSVEDYVAGSALRLKTRSDTGAFFDDLLLELIISVLI